MAYKPRTIRTSNVKRPVLVSGIQPSGRLHVGNYLGALKNFVDLQNSGKYRCYFFIADLHSLTEEYTPKEKAKQVLELAADFLAAGLNSSTSLGASLKKSVIFQQSQVPAHSELAWILNTITPIGELYRMTQFKDKSDRKHDVNTGLLTYPTLMAADIIMYDAKFVPVGNDQDQHLELTRTLARKFNAKFGKTFVEPQALHTPTARVMSLKDPTKKMSKSQPETCLFLDDTPREIQKKVMSAVTDSGSEVKYGPGKPGVSNLLGILSAVSGRSVAALEREFKGKGYGDFKGAVATGLIEHLAPYQKKKKALLAKPATLKSTLRRGSGQAGKVTIRKIADVKKRVGLVL